MKQQARESKTSLQNPPRTARERRAKPGTGPEAGVQGGPAQFVAQLATQINASNRVQSLAQLRQQIDRSPRMQMQLRMEEDAGALRHSDRSFVGHKEEDAEMAAGASAPSSDSCGTAKLHSVQPMQASPKEKLLQHRESGTAAANSAAEQVSQSVNKSGLPPQLKSGVESLSGMSMDHVKVHYNSGKPAQLNALAYAQGSDIHVAPGQEKHLPHEAWHVVQQAQGRVRPTMQMKDGVPVNDDKGLEREADLMGARAAQFQAIATTDNHLTTTAQHERLQGSLQNAAQLQLSEDESAGSVFQRKIHVKTGKKYDRAAPETDQKTASIAEANGIYLVQSDDDVTKMKGGVDVPVLAPKKHLIGEVHSTSRFRDAVAAWGWGAELVMESYSKHPKLKNPQQTRKEKSPVKQGVYDENFMYARAKGLENTAVKGLANIINAQIFGSYVVKMANNNQTPLTFQNTDKVQLKKFCEDTWAKYAEASNVVQSLEDYLVESKNERGFGVFGKHFLEHEAIAQVVTPNLVQRIKAGQDNVFDQYNDPNVSHLDPVILANCNSAIDNLVPLLQKLIVAYDPGVFSLPDIEQASSEAKNKEDIGELNPLREEFMARNITAARIPALVKIGAAHVANLRNNPPAETLLYDNYAAFETKNTLKKVDV